MSGAVAASQGALATQPVYLKCGETVGGILAANGITEVDLFNRMQTAMATWDGFSQFLNGLSEGQLAEKTIASLGSSGGQVLTYRELRDYINTQNALVDQMSALDGTAAHGGLILQSGEDWSGANAADIQISTMAVLLDRVTNNQPDAIQKAQQYLKNLQAAPDKVTLSVEAAQKLSSDEIAYENTHAHGNWAVYDAAGVALAVITQKPSVDTNGNSN